MAFHPLRVALYSALFIFSAITLGLTANRISRTRRARFNDPLNFNRAGFYEPAVSELLAASIIALLWSVFGMCAIFAAAGGIFGSYLTEFISLFCIWVLYLVGASIVTHNSPNLGWCRPWSYNCRLMSSVISFSWITWAITTFLLLASLASLLSGRHRITEPLHGKDEGRAEGGTGAGNTRGVRVTPPRQGGAPLETRGVDTAPATTTGGAYQQQVA